MERPGSRRRRAGPSRFANLGRAARRWLLRCLPSLAVLALWADIAVGLPDLEASEPPRAASRRRADRLCRGTSLYRYRGGGRSRKGRMPPGMATPATGIPAHTGEGGNMITKDVIPDVLGRTAYDGAHNKIGKIGNVYVDEQTGQPEWMTVHTGMFGRRETFVPLEPAQVRDNEVLVPFDKQQIKNAPTVDVDTAGHLSVQEEALMYDYYGMQQPTRPPTPPTMMAGGPATGEEMTRSEERLHVGKETREAGRAHLRKYVVTEDQQQTIPVRKEKVRLEREPISVPNRGKAMAEPGISEADYEVVREEERPVVAKETVPVERVRLAKDATTEQETVGGQVREERIDADGFQEER